MGGMKHIIVAAFAFQAAPALAITDARVDRIDATSVKVSWIDAKPVSVFVTTDPAAGIKGATPAGAAIGGGSVTVPADANIRRYFLLKGSDGKIVRVAERLLPLTGGSNFRDLGGYAAAGGKHVRWGKIYRSGATPLLTDGDVTQVKALGIGDLIDLRSSEERVLAPTRLDGIRYNAIGYSMMTMLPKNLAELKNGSTLYRNFPTFFAPQIKLVFAKLLGNQGAVAYNCSAGQDRTGFTSAMILSALGVPRDTIVKDYLLSTPSRRPENELPPISDAMAASSPVARMFQAYQKMPNGNVAQPLVEADGTPFLTGAFDEIEKRYGSVDNYLTREIGLSKADMAKLRLLYLE